MGRKELPGHGDLKGIRGLKVLPGQQERLGRKARPGLHFLDILMADSRLMGYSWLIGLRTEGIIVTGATAGIL